MRKRQKLNSSDFILIGLFLFLLVMVIGIIVLFLVFQPANAMQMLVYDLMKELLSAVAIGLVVGVITKFVTNKMFSVQLNMRKLREFGINGIGTGQSKENDIRAMFGKEGGERPKYFKVMFITGNVFFKDFQMEMIKCMDAGCEIQVLLASPEDFNKPYLKRIAERYDMQAPKDYSKEIYEETLKTIAFIRDKSKNPNNINVRFYKDEYQNNIRISKYLLKNGDEKSYFWINVQPLCKAAINLSVALKGEVNSFEKNNQVEEKSDLYKHTEQGFDYLWYKYSYTEFKFNK